ncbi:MAG: ImmA/IrrE family metallo-endopeptidase [Eubacterium sp.]|nr:ImmA/IrrE family metallo-endopeptidase [Eubacterium sp.]
MTYEELLIESDNSGLIAKEKNLQAHDGRLRGNRVAIRQSIQSEKKKACVLAEELGHYHTSSGDILDQQSIGNRKQENKARMWAYDKMIGLCGIIDCCKRGISTIHDAADYCGVTEQFMIEAIKAYRLKYGICTQYKGYTIYFEPWIGIMQKIGEGTYEKEEAIR